MRKRSLGLSLLAVLAVVAGACNAGGSPAAKALKIGLVTDVGGLNDKSFNEASWNGTQDGATKVGGTAQNIVTKAPADYAANIQTFVDQKYDVIVTVGFALGDATLKAATANPTVKFIGVDQFICVPKDANDKACAGTIPANYQGVIFVEAQAGYLVGIVAGSLTKSNVIGAVGGINTIPPVVSYIRGFQNGVASVNATAKVLIQYADTDITKAFNEPDKGKSIAEQMIGQKADWLFQVAGGTGVGVLQAACAAPGVYGIGVDVDQAPSFPDLKCVVTSAEKHLALAISAAIVRVSKGTDKGGNIVNDAKSDPVGVGISDFHDLKSMMTPALQAAVDKALAGLKDGTLDPCKPNACTP
ncbi:MAG TPA: BMP family ABC transporter substrate-binding protein [Candidatus Limnocylindrales bacterium]|nr:BMP family ABC transporter substrate-binding protein [Candidatus Limnocylindrales bacterium]